MDICKKKKKTQTWKLTQNPAAARRRTPQKQQLPSYCWTLWGIRESYYDDELAHAY